MKFLGHEIYLSLVFSSLIVIFITYFIWSRKRALSLWKRLGVPGPEPNFWFGNAKQLTYGRVNVMSVLEDWKSQYGRVFGYYIGLRPALNICDADMVKEIFVKQFSKFVNRPDSLQYEQNLARLRDNEWKEVRRIMNPVFTTKKLKNLANMINEVENVLLEVLGEKAENKESVPSYRTAQGLTFQIITKTAFAMDIDSQRNEQDPFYQNSKAWLSYPFSIFQFLILMFPGLTYLFRFLNTFDKRYTFWKDMGAHIRNIINYRRSNPDIMQGNQDLLGLMLEAAEGKNELSKELTTNILKDPEEDEKTSVKKTIKNVVGNKDKFLISDTQMVDNLILFLMAGFDSTSNTIAFAFHFLAKHPEVQEKAYEEIMREIGEQEVISAEDCRKLKYVEQIIFETLRLFPPVPVFLHRQCAEDVEIGGIKIPKGVVVECPPWLLHRDEEYWENPLEFNPDRFSSENKKENNYAFIPFGTGPRMCLGARFALIEATTALARVIRAFKISPSANFKEELKVRVMNILLNPAEEIYVDIVKRN